MKKYLRFIPSLIWMAIIFYFSSRQTTGIGGDSFWLRFFILKSFHLIEYGLLFIFINFAINNNLNSIIISYLYGVSDEIHQSFIPGRTARLTDTLIDLLGIFIGLLMLKAIIIPFLNKQKLLNK
jgi:VanZ family protein